MDQNAYEATTFAENGLAGFFTGQPASLETIEAAAKEAERYFQEQEILRFLEEFEVLEQLTFWPEVRNAH